MMETVLVGIDLGGTNAQGAAALDGKIIRQEKIPTVPNWAPKPSWMTWPDWPWNWPEAEKLQPWDWGCRDLLDLERGLCVFSGNLGWDNVPVKAKLEEKTGAPVFMDNDVRVAAAGNWPGVWPRVARTSYT